MNGHVVNSTSTGADLAFQQGRTSARNAQPPSESGLRHD